MNNKLEKEQEDTKIEFVKQVEVESQRILVGELKPEKGHTLFEINLKTNEIGRAEFKTKGDVNFEQAVKGDLSNNKEVDIKEDCFYVSALNEKNAWKKLKKRFENA